MKTDELIDKLAARPVAIDPRYAMHRFGAALAAGTAIAAVAMASILGPRHDFAQAIALPMFWVKLVFVTSLAALGVIAAFRVGIPGQRIDAVVRTIAGVVGTMWIIAAVALVESAPQARPALLLGATWTSCPWLIAALSVPVFVAVAASMKAMAPTHLRRAGAIAGFASGALAALVYSIHCPELGAPFLGTWYVLGILVPTAAGAFLGRGLFRW